MMIMGVTASMQRADRESEKPTSGSSSIASSAESDRSALSEIHEVREGSVTAVTLSDAKVVASWCDRYGVTVDQLTRATTMVGFMPAALHFYLTSHGRPTKQVTDAMRASRPPIPPRDRRRKAALLANKEHSGGEARLEAERLATEHSVRQLNLHIAGDALHERPSPKTIIAYDMAKKLLEETLAKLERTTALLMPASRLEPEDG